MFSGEASNRHSNLLIMRLLQRHVMLFSKLAIKPSCALRSKLESHLQ
jgi:hypothetical protein